LLKILARIAPPTSGRVVLNGRVAPLLGIARVVMNLDVSGRDNVHLVAGFYDIPRAVVARRMPAIMRFAGLEGHEDRLGKTYSSGLWRRLAFSILLNLEPDILLADEELLVGDAAFREQSLRAIEEAKADGLTLLFASHDMEMVNTLCDEAVLMENGEIAARGPAAEITQAYESARRPPTATATAPKAPEAGKAAVGRRDGKPVKDLPSQEGDERLAIVATNVFSREGFPVESIARDEPVLVEVELDARKAGLGVRCVLALTAKGAARLRARQPEMFEIKEPGLYTVTVFVPGGSLPDAVYRGRVGVWVYEDGDRTVLDRRDAFSLDVQNEDDRNDDDDDEDDDGPIELDDVARSLIWDVSGTVEPAAAAR
jgi:lipopolysaccharide transport system ATP-binding protein